MKKRILIGSIIAVVILIGVSFIPSISANVSKEEELVEFTTEFCGINSKKQIIKLTQEEANEVELLFDDIQNKLINIESRAEAKEIVSHTLTELHKYGFLGDLSTKQVQRLILSGMDRQYLFSRLIEKLSNEFNFWNTNLFCLIGGYSKNVDFFRMSSYIFIFPYILTLLAYPIYKMNPLKLLSVVSFGSSSWHFEGPSYTNYAKGIISSIGLLGIKCWIGEFKGNADVMSFEFAYSGWAEYIGIIGFTGIQISRIDQDDTFLLGFAIYVNMKHV